MLWDLSFSDGSPQIASSPFEACRAVVYASWFSCSQIAFNELVEDDAVELCDGASREKIEEDDEEADEAIEEP